jgi:hypothetical protein
MLNKKGNVMDTGFIVVIAFAMFIGGLFYFTVFDSFTGGLINSTGLHNVTNQQLTMHRSNVYKTFDSVFSLLFFGAFFAIIASAYFIRTNMAFFMIGVLIVTIFSFVAATLSNAYSDILLSDGTLRTFVTTNFTLSNHIMENYPLYTVILGMLLLISLYAKISSAPT